MVGQRVARSLPERWPAPAHGVNLAVQGHRLALEGTALVAAPLLTAAAGTLKIPACVCLRSSSPAFPRPLIARHPAPTGSRK
jgi:hypothetical protein